MLWVICEDLDVKYEVNFIEVVLILGMSFSIGFLFGRDYGGKVFFEEI